MSATRIELQGSAAQTGSSQGASKPIPTITMAAVLLDITAGSGTITDFTAWLQGSDDEEDWFDIVADQVMNSTAVAAGGTVTTNDRDIVDGKSTTTAEKFMAVYKHLPFKYVRFAWALAGTTPSLTFDAVLIGK